MESNSTLNRILKDGALYGFIGVIVGLLVYIIDVSMFASLWFLGFLMLFTLALVITFSLRYRKDLGGYVSFKDAFIYSFFIMAVAGFIGNLFNIVLFGFIDPGAVDTIAQASIENTESLMENWDMPEDKMDEALDKAEQDVYDRFTIWGMIKGYFTGLIFYAVTGLIVSAIIKKKEQEREI